jgi:hypothetical protein|tara:strand:- start:278 stop:481 length:204 start_codon:yes stop_codon:yes gene_type:complete
MKNRVNKNNKPVIIKYIINRFDKIMMEKGKISLIDLWDVEIEIEKKFNISDYQSGKLSNHVLQTGGL